MSSRLRRVLDVVVVHAILLVASAAVLYPVLWVLRLALSPSGRLGEPGALPICKPTRAQPQPGRFFRCARVTWR